MADEPQPQPQSTPQPPQPSLFLTHVVKIDTAWSRHLHALAEPVIPRATLKILEFSGDGRLWFPIAIALLLSPLSLHSPHLYSASLSLLLGLVVDIAAVGLIKHLVRRPRPVYNKSMGLTFAVDHWSFPSGHSSRVCFIAALFYLSIAAVTDGIDQLKLRKGEIVDRWIGDHDSGKLASVSVVVVLIWSVITSVSRVLLGRHFVFDVVVGACVGVVNAFFVYHFLRF